MRGKPRVTEFHRQDARTEGETVAAGDVSAEGSRHTDHDTGATEAAGGIAPDTPIAAGRRRRWPTVLLALTTVVATGAAVAFGLVAADQRDVAAEWRDRAAALEEQRDDLDRQRDTLDEQLTEAISSLELSERDVSELDERVRTLAEEKARAEDTATTVQVERDVFIELSELISDATTSLDSCVTQLFDLQASSVEAFNRASADQAVDLDALNARSGEVTRFCNQARTAAANAEAAADQLLRP